MNQPYRIIFVLYQEYRIASYHTLVEHIVYRIVKIHGTRRTYRIVSHRAPQSTTGHTNIGRAYE